MRPSRHRLLALPVALLLAVPLRPAGAPAQEIQRVAPFVPTPMNAVAEMLDLAGVTGRDTVYDLGSGDGRVPIAAARLNGAFGVGVEMDSALVDESRLRARELGVGDRVRIVRGDLFEADLTGASVVTLYLYPEVNERLRPRLLRQLDPGDRVVTHDFAMGEWEADSTARIPGATAVGDSFEWTEIGPDGEALTTADSAVGSDRGGEDLEVRLKSLTMEAPAPVPGPSTLYLWIAPADLEGLWSLELPDGRAARIRIDQRFQELRAHATGPGEPRVVGAAVRGDSVRLRIAAGSAADRILTGTVAGDRMAASSGGGWSGRRVADGDSSLVAWQGEPPEGPGQRDRPLR